MSGMSARTANEPLPRRIVLTIAALGLASGIPYQMVNDALSAWLSDAKVPVEAIGLLGLATLPYGLKFLWAPLLDARRFPLLAALGRRRSWLLSMQTACALLIVALAVSVARAVAAEPIHSSPDFPNIRLDLLLVGGVALLLALCSATLDIVVDAFRADAVPRHWLGAGASAYVVGYRMAMVLAGAGVLLLPSYIGWPAAFALAAALLALPALATLWVVEPVGGTAVSFVESVTVPLVDLWQRFGRSLIPLGIFVLFYRLPDMAASRMVMPFLIQDLGFTTEEIGLLRQFGGALVTIVGALVGGLSVQRFGVTRCLVVFGILQAASNGGYLWLGAAGHSIAVFCTAVAIENFCNGLVAAVFVAYLMSLCNPRTSATQYALFTGIMFLAAAIAAAPGGYLVREIGYPGFFLITIAAGIPGVALIWVVAPLSKHIPAQPN